MHFKHGLVITVQPRILMHDGKSVLGLEDSWTAVISNRSPLILDGYLCACHSVHKQGVSAGIEGT